MNRIAANALLVTGVALLVIATVVRLPPLVDLTAGLISQAAVLSFYWLHCAGPALYYAGATPTTMRVVKGIGIAAFATVGVSLTLNMLHGNSSPVLVAAVIGSNAWYLAAWPVPQVIGRLSGGLDAAEATRRRAAIERTRATG